MNQYARSQQGFTLIELMIVVMILGLLAAIAIPNLVSFQHHAKEVSLKSNCHTVQIAAEDWASRNNGTYANSIIDQLPSGDRIIDLLPGGNLLVNPWTGVATEPRDGVAGQSGQTGYLPIQENGVNVGYSIDGYGRAATVIIISNG